MCYGIIYKIENKINGKIYIGQTTRTFDERYRGSIKNTHNEHLKKSIKKHGIEKFDIDKCVCTCETKEELDRVEQFYIYVYDAANPEHGYNLTFGGEGGIPNEETRKKLSESMKKVLADPEIKKRQSEGVKKALANPETRKKMSEIFSGEKNPMYGKNAEDYMTEEAIKIKREKQSEAHKGEKHHMYKKHLSEETKQKISESLKGKYCGEKNSMWGKNSEDYMTPEAIQMRREKLSKALKGKHRSEETKQKIGEAKKGEKNPNARAVIQLNKNGDFIRKYYFIKQAARELNIACQSISACCKGRIKSAGGYKWMYETEYLDLLRYAF